MNLDSFTLRWVAIAIALGAGMVGFLELGRWIGVRRLEKDPEGARIGVQAIEGAIFALLGLLLAFTFSGAANRLDIRRQIIVDEANAIGTAYLRLDMLSEDSRAELQTLFREYVETRLKAYKEYPDEQAIRRGLGEANQLQQKIWNAAITATRQENYQPAAMLLLPALNEMIDITTTRGMAAQTHPPAIIFAMLTFLLLCSALLAGIAMAGGKSRSWIHILSYAAVSAVTMYVIIDLEYPRLGLLQLTDFDVVLENLRQSLSTDVKS
jgi:hypothetical protein